jgi:hypothetical protein
MPHRPKAFLRVRAAAFLAALACSLTIGTSAASGDGSHSGARISGQLVAESARLVPALDAVLLERYRESRDCPEARDPGALRYVASRIDLNRDSHPETIVLMLGTENLLGSETLAGRERPPPASACASGGCTALVLGDAQQGFPEIARITSVSAPIFAADSTRDGWRGLIVGVYGGGAEGGERILAFEHGSYPTNASMAPMATAKTIAAAGEPLITEEAATPDRAHLLVPADCPNADSVAVSESLGKVHLGDGTSVVLRRLRKPASRGKPQMWDADALFHRQWGYPDQGVSVNFSAEHDKGPWRVSAIWITAPSKLTTGKGIGIGASLEQVTRSYAGAAAEKEATGRTWRMWVGSQDTGLVFDVDEHEAVTRIYLGPMSE